MVETPIPAEWPVVIGGMILSIGTEEAKMKKWVFYDFDLKEVFGPAFDDKHAAHEQLDAGLDNVSVVCLSDKPVPEEVWVCQISHPDSSQFNSVYVGESEEAVFQLLVGWVEAYWDGMVGEERPDDPEIMVEKYFEVARKLGAEDYEINRVLLHEED